MSKLNLLLSLNAYEDVNAVSHPAKSTWKWVSDLQGIEIAEPKSEVVKLAPGETYPLFSSQITTLADNTTTYDLNLKAGSTTLYVLKANGGQAPQFRTPRAMAGAADSAVTVTKNGATITFTQTAGTAWLLTPVVVGDEVRIQNIFNTVNQGKFKVIAKTATSFTVENPFGQAEGPIVLGGSYATDVTIYSQAGVQIGNKVKIDSGFSSVSFGTYEITDVGANFVSFNSTKSLPSETAISSSIDIFDNYKRLLYIESNKRVSVLVDGVSNGTIEPFQVGTTKKPGMIFRSSLMYSASITNESTETASVFIATAE